MPSAEERLKIIKLVEQGVLTAEEAIRLLNAADAARPAAAPEEPAVAPRPAGASRWLRVRVTDQASNKVRVNLRLPVNLVQAGLKMGARFSPEVHGLDPEQLMAFVNSGEVGKLVDFYDDESNERVEVFVE